MGRFTFWHRWTSINIHDAIDLIKKSAHQIHLRTSLHLLTGAAHGAYASKLENYNWSTTKPVCKRYKWFVF